MRIVIFGATGRTGQRLVEQALAAGHAVTAFARSVARLPQRDRVRVVEGDIYNAVRVEEAIQGQDAVLCVVGLSPDSPRDLMQTAARHIVAGMQRHGVRRLVTLTGAGVVHPNDPPSLGRSVMVPLLKLLSPKVLEDAARHVAIIADSGLDWTVVRCPVLSDGPPTSKYRTGYLAPAGPVQVARADVADFMLKQLESATYLREMPMILY